MDSFGRNTQPTQVAVADVVGKDQEIAKQQLQDQDVIRPSLLDDE